MAEKKKINKRKLKYRCIGISNMAYNRQENKYYSVQFYDFDFHDYEEEQKLYLDTHISEKEIMHISNIFPYDLLLYRTKHGIHFISFALVRGTWFTKAQAVELSKKLGNQDYWCSQRDLILRVSPKWKVNRDKTYKVVSKKPTFLRCMRKPFYMKNLAYSIAHIDFYHEYLGLPDNLYYEYLDLGLMNCELKLYHYKARD